MKDKSVRKLVLIGMSNEGKTFQAERLVPQGLAHHCVDAMIESVLDPELKAAGYAGGITDVAKWMGMPGSTMYAARQTRYLELEYIMTSRAVLAASNAEAVVDTTGSVVHLSSTVFDVLRKSAVIVYLKTRPEDVDKKFQQYMAEPKPVVFGSIWEAPILRQTYQDALEKAYRALLQWRSLQYELLADITIDAADLRQDNVSGVGFTDLIEALLNT